MHIVHTIGELRQAISAAARPAFVPTMGNLHRGHLSLLEIARQLGDCTVASIFVNRLQFLSGEDFDRYPRTWDADCKALASHGCDVLFAPREEDLYPEPQRYKVAADPALASKLEGGFRPGFFDGVCTVVLKLFMAVFAGKSKGIAVFGKKDYQQLRIVEAMTRQFALPVDIIAAETARDDDGLALSSRNSYLSIDQRKQASDLYQQLLGFAQGYRLRAGDQTIEAWVKGAEKTAVEQLQMQGWQVDYLSLRRCEDLEPAYEGHRLVVLAAAKLGQTRLIDNIEI
ncbi:MAG: pantoate--beta-alanine ligase [Betaproteobacteria bacterium]|nr:pantoate--beta-alanine ligase [Betaproteobacteria bacterium]